MVISLKARRKWPFLFAC